VQLDGFNPGGFNILHPLGRLGGLLNLRRKSEAEFCLTGIEASQSSTESIELYGSPCAALASEILESALSPCTDI